MEEESRTSSWGHYAYVALRYAALWHRTSVPCSTCLPLRLPSAGVCDCPLRWRPYARSLALELCALERRDVAGVRARSHVGARAADVS